MFARNVRLPLRVLTGYHLFGTADLFYQRPPFKARLVLSPSSRLGSDFRLKGSSQRTCLQVHRRGSSLRVVGELHEDTTCNEDVCLIFEKVAFVSLFCAETYTTMHCHALSTAPRGLSVPKVI